MSSAAIAAAAIVAIVLLIALYLGKLGRTRTYTMGPDPGYTTTYHMTRVRSAARRLYGTLARVNIDLKTGLGRQGVALREAAAAMGLPAPSLDRLLAVLDDGSRRLDTYVSTYLVSPSCDASGQGACGILTLLEPLASLPSSMVARVCAAAQAAYEHFPDVVRILPGLGDAITDLIREFKLQAQRQHKSLSLEAQAAVDALLRSGDVYNNLQRNGLADGMISATSALCAHGEGVESFPGGPRY